jgi:hypothetical protein
MLTVAFNQFINPVAIDAIGWWYYVFYCAWLVVELVFVVTCIVETRGTADQLPHPHRVANWLLGRTLEETAALFDGDEQPQDLVAMGGDAATQTMTNRHVRLFDLERKPSQKKIVEFHELRLRRQSEDFSIFGVLSKEPGDPITPRGW